MTAQKWLVGASMVALLLTTNVGSASANGYYGGYICNAEYRPGNAAGGSNFGSYGWGYISVYSGPDCTGTYLWGGYMCTVNATYAWCANTNEVLYTYWNIMPVMQELIEASQWNYHVFVTSGACKGTATDCYATLQFLAN
jgi:hypothetical protein